MNKQALYLFGGALLASTALTTASQAATIKTNPGSAAADAKPSTTAITAKGIATQVFSGTAATAGAVTISGSSSSTAASDILIDYSSTYNTAFNIQLDVSGAEFTGTPTIFHYFQSTSGGSLELVGSVTGCTVQTLSDKILISSCDPQNSGGSVSRVDAIAVRGITFQSAGALVTAGTSVTLSGIIRNSANTITFETITAAAVVTSKSAIVASVDQGTALTIDNTATIAFSKLGSPAATSAVLGTIQFSGNAAVGTDLSTVILGSSVASTTEVKITHGVLSDSALTEIRYLTNGAVTTTKTPGQFGSGTVTFSVAGNSLNGATIVVQFNGTAGISVATGSATVTPTAAAPTIAAVAAFSGSLATLTRGGLSIQLNTLLPTASANYSSFVRLVNSSTVSGTATVTVSNDATGVALGTYTTASIAAGGTLTISSTDIETALGLTSSASVNYKVTLAGSFNGYAQHLVYNKTSGVFSDFSGFRNGALTIDP